MASLFENIVSGARNLFGGGQQSQPQRQSQPFPTPVPTPTPSFYNRPVYGPSQPTYGPPAPTPLYQPPGVLGASATRGGGGGSQPQLQQQQEPGPQNFEQAPEQPDMSFVDELLNPAISNLDALEGETRSLLGGGEAQAESYRGAAETQAKGAKETGLAQVGTAESKARTAAGEAEAQQRRGFSEISQNILGRYGRTGFGQGVLGSLGENTLQTVGRIKVGLQETINTLNTRRNELEDIFNSAVQEAKLESENLKQNARAQLQQALGQIGQSRVALATRRAEMVNSALDQHRQTLQAINARNTAFQQSLETMRIQSQQKIAEAQQRANQAAANLPSFTLQPGETKFLPLNELGGQQGFDELAGTQLPGGVQSGQFGKFGVFSAPGKKEEDPYEALLKSAGVGG